MKSAYKLEILVFGVFYILLLMIFTSCEQEDAVVELKTAPGGGTVSTYKAYSVNASSEDDVYGRIVFYKDNSDFTLVQVSLYNTLEEVDYETTLFSGAETAGTPAVIKELYNVDGSTGEFSSSKFYVIADKTFYAGLDELDAHLKITAGELLISTGNVGRNALPVAESE